MKLTGGVPPALGQPDIRSSESRAGVCWLGAVSFEQRCTGSLDALARAHVPLTRAVAYDYPTQVSPAGSGAESRASNRRRLETLMGGMGEVRTIHPYRYAEFIGQLDALADEIALGNGDGHLVVDITCLTKMHTLAVAYWIVTRASFRNVTIAYSQPKSYGSPSKNTWGKGKWLKVLVGRLDIESTAPYLSAHALAILGHEGDRLRLALNEVEADRGLVVSATPEDPGALELATVSDVQNSWLFEEVAKGIRLGFSQCRLGLGDLDTLWAATAEFCGEAQRSSSRMVLCPFGPKPFVFAAGCALLATYRENSWFSYPIPASYEVTYSQGYRRTLWLDPERPILGRDHTETRRMLVAA